MLFGVDAPKFVADPTGTPVTVLLDYILILKDIPEKDLVENKSPLNGHREYILKGKHWEFEIRMNLFKYCNGADYTNARAKYEEIKAHEGSDVWLYRHREAAPFKDSSGAEVLFTITSIDEAYLDTTDFKDLLIITFKSKDYVDLSDGTLPVIQANEVIMNKMGI